MSRTKYPTARKRFRARCKVAQGGFTTLSPALFTEDAVAPVGVSVNFGGFLFHSAGGVLRDGVIVPDTAMYRVSFACNVLANSQDLVVQLTVNGTSALADGSVKDVFFGGPASITNHAIELVHELPLIAGDTVGFLTAQAPGPQNLAADTTIWTVEKMDR